MKERLIEILKEALEIESVNLDDYLDGYDNWDSLTKLSLIALIDEHFEIQVSDQEFNEFETGEDLYKALLKKKID
jgi:acyl carrier protein